MDEIWKEIPGFEGKYQVSNMGRVRSIPHEIQTQWGKYLTKERVLKPRVSNTGYLRVHLSITRKTSKTISVHRLVAEAFIDKPLNKDQVNHIDGNKLNNNAENLEWCSQSENMQHAYKTGLQTKGKDKKVYQYTLDGQLIKIWEQVQDIQKAKIMHSSTLERMRKKGKEEYKGYIWKYEEDLWNK